VILPLLLTAITALSPANPVQSSRNMAVADAEGCTLTVVLQCAVAADGAAKDCSIASEDPNTMGAGQAALAMSASFHLKAREDGERVYLPVRIQAEQCRAAH